MVDAVFRRAAQNKSDLSYSDKTILGAETQALQNCKYALCISEPDRSAVIEKFPSTRTLLFPIIRFARTPQRQNDRRSRNLLFIGSLVHTPNRMAAEWIVKELAPKLNSINPEIQLVFAGQGTKDFDQAHSNVTGLGLVADLNVLYSESFATIAPMKIAAGINGKVVESLCFQIPPIISEPVSTNLPRGLLENCEIARNTQEYAAIANRIYKDQNKYAERKYTLKEVNGASNIEILIHLLNER
jgi:hypothetical protein